MYLKTVLAAVTALLFAGQAMGTAMIATDPLSACNCPNNCKHKARSSCKYYSGPSDSSPVASGRCAYVSGSLLCVAQ